MEEELKKLIDSGPQRTTIVSVVEEQKPDDTFIHIRGVVQNLGPKVPRGFLSAVPIANPPAIPTSESGRRQLGEWLARRDNPLPARVMANRAWHWLTGDGLVRTVDNFGTTGEQPSHPQLLDDLASRFVEDGWSVKKLVRRIVLSRTYQISAATDSKAVAVDPENRLRWRANRRRLDAECIRDAMLSVSGQLDTTVGGPTFKPSVTADYGYKHADTRRSVYSPVFRNALPELFEAFDFADPSTPTGRRTVSTVAPQALFLMNHPFVREQANAAAAKLLAEPGLDDAGRTVRAYRFTLGRAATKAEIKDIREFLSSARPADARGQQEAWSQVFHALFGSIDFRYVE
jgi:hypothetical protein